MVRLSRTSSKRAIVRHFIQYHNADKMGYGCAGIKPDPLDIVTQKPVTDIRGEVVWILCGEGKPRRYGICARFIVTDIEKGPDGTTSVAGKGTLLKREIPLNDEPWFKEFLSDHQNFSLGFREIKHQAYIDELEKLMAPSLKEGLSASKTQPAKRLEQTKEQPAPTSAPRAEPHAARRGASLGKDEPVEVFIAYSHEDQGFLKEIEKSLKIISRTVNIKLWHARNITPGNEWRAEIAQNLGRAHIILLLVSRDFIASDYCHDVELKEAMRRHRAGEAIVIPIIFRRCEWQNTPLGGIQALPEGGEPVKEWKHEDVALSNIERGICAAIAKLRGEPPQP
jgi:hypothetical protein